MDKLFIFTRGVAIGLTLLFCLKLWINDRHLQAGRMLLAVMVGIGAYLVVPLLDSSLWLKSIAVILATSVPAMFWLFTQSLFNDWDQKNLSVGPLRSAAIGLFLVVAFASYGLGRPEEWLGPPAAQAMFYLAYLFRVVFLMLALSAILGEWSQDLLESRRRLRRIMIGLGGAYILVVIVAELILGGRPAPLLLELGHSLLLTLLLLVLSVWLLFISPDGLSASLEIPSATKPSNDDTEKPDDTEDKLSLTEQNWLEALRKHIETDCGYRNTNLTIGKLGERLLIPEHHLRRLINRHLGYRNFNDFLNHYRIAAAAKRLAEPEQERLPILTIALDVGYASLTPFNRAFKVLHQQTPSEYRRQQLQR